MNSAKVIRTISARTAWTIAIAVIIAIGLFFFYELSPVNGSSTENIAFTVQEGEGFRTIAGNLYASGLTKSEFSGIAAAAILGKAEDLKPGVYSLSPSMSVLSIIEKLSESSGEEVTVTIPEGADMFQIDKILSNASVIKPGELINYGFANHLEGQLFPDTYRFFTGSKIGDVVEKFLEDWNVRAAPLFSGSGIAAATTSAAAADGTGTVATATATPAPAKLSSTAEKDLIMASIIEKEVSDPQDQKIVSGILWKRLYAGMPLQTDATICYAMRLAAVATSSSIVAASQAATPPSISAAQSSAIPTCNSLDLKIDSPYNTYLYKGLPPGPIGNPGITAIDAAIHPVSSPYWYYLSDPATGKTVFAKTLDEQHQNTVKYLERN